MASSRVSSRASDAPTPSPEPLTPRSKIKALLATVDSTDDEEGPGTSSVSRRARVQGSSRSTGHDEESDESDESDVVIRPRGKLASRMQGVSRGPQDNEAARRELDVAPGGAGSSPSHREPETTPQQTRQRAGVDRGEDHEDDQNVLPMAARRLKRRSPVPHSLRDLETPAREPSPGLFVSSPPRPSSAKSNHTNDSDSDEELPAPKSDRFKALFERKRQERLAREAAEEAREADQRARQEQRTSELDAETGDESGITDDEGGRTLNQKARPTRKASKKAVEEMNRETQRLARNMQLAPEPKTRKTIPMTSLFARFNYRPATGSHSEPQIHSSSRPTTSQSDVDINNAETPPSSPPRTKDQGSPSLRTNHVIDASDDELPTLDQVIDQAAQSSPQGKGKAVAVAVDEASCKVHKPRRRVRVRLPPAALKAATLDSNDELEVKCTTKDKVDAVFNSITVKDDEESRSLRALRALALVRSPGKRGQKDTRPGMTAAELHMQLYQKARQQVRLERERRLEMLKSQGVLVQTADERERQEQVEDLVARAREEAQQIMQQERAASKKEKNESGSVDPLAWDDSEDDEYAEAAYGADDETSAIELSGSDSEPEDEEGEDDENSELGTKEDAAKPLFDEDAEVEGSEIDKHSEHDTSPESDAEEPSAAKPRRARKHTTILSDDEAEIEATPKPKAKTVSTTPAETRTASPAVPTSVLRFAKKTFIPGLPVQGPAGLGLTQIFAGTMDDSQMMGGPTQSMMPDIDHFPDSKFSATADEPAEEIVMDTQREQTPAATQGTQGFCLDLSQSQMRGLESLLPDSLHTQMSGSIEPSQDVGLQEHTPLRDRFIEPPVSTVETIAADKQVHDTYDSPLVRRGRLRREMDVATAGEGETQATQVNAFQVLVEGAKDKRRPADSFDRNKTKAKDMVEEQAEESEDEYAGLGGADGEGSDNESTGSVGDIIDDAQGNDVDEGELAAFYADRERANDEMEVEKLFKDITRGMLRRKRGADYDLSDSDSGGEARQRMKRRQFSKMQRALYADERVKKMAENPGNQAFLRTMEDRGSDDEMDLVGMAPEQPESQHPSQEDGGGRQGPTTTADDGPGTQPPGQGRAPAHRRRTAGGGKPSSLGQVRKTLSNLLEERQGSIVPATEPGSESDDGGDARRCDKENQAPSGAAVVDRLRLKRTGSCAASTARLAFAAHASTPSFKVPALLRRATTNSTRMSSSSSSAATTATATATTAAAASAATASSSLDDKLRKGAGKTSGVVHGRGPPRDAEAATPTAVAAAERRRARLRARGAAHRVGVVGGLLGRGSFG